MSSLVDAAQQPRFNRGYTGHEHLCAHGLINMNGRLYGPQLQRFLSPDPYVQQPGNSQSYNRYSYCMNNPLMYTDPSGEELITLCVVVALIVVPMAIDYFVQVANNDDHQGVDRWTKGIDFFDIAVTGGVAAICVFGSPLAGFIAVTGSPWLTNAIDVEYGEEEDNDNWQMDVVGVKSRHKEGKYIEPDKTAESYVVNSAIQSAANAITYCAFTKNPFETSSAKSFYNRNILKNPTNAALKEIKPTLAGAGVDFNTAKYQNAFNDKSTDYYTKWNNKYRLPKVNTPTNNSNYTPNKNSQLLTNPEYYSNSQGDYTEKNPLKDLLTIRRY